MVVAAREALRYYRKMKTIKNVLKKLPIVPTVYRNVRDRLLANKNAVMTPFGFRFVGSNLMQKGEFEKEDVKLFQRFLGGVDLFIDAGAHAGYYCLQALNVGKHVIAFEPMSLNMRMLLKNVALNGFGDNAEIFQLALSEKPDIAKMYGGGTGASLVKGWAGFSGRSPILVPVSSLDVVLGNRLAGKRILILVDVEGAEYGLLKGAGILLAATPKPIWMMEIAYSNNQPDGRGKNPRFIETFEIFWEHGYEAYVFNDKNLHRLEPSQMRADTERAIRDAKSNFIFIHRESRGTAESVEK